MWYHAVIGPGKIHSVKILRREVSPSPPGASERGALVIDLHFTDGDNEFIVEVQRYSQPAFPRRANLYGFAASVQQFLKTYAAPASPTGESRAQERAIQKPPHVHVLSFVDFELGPAGANNQNFPHLGALHRDWRTDGCAQKSGKLVSIYRLLPDIAAARLVDPGAESNPALDEFMRNELSQTFVQLPHAPQLEALSADSHPLHVWASMVAHAHPDTISALLPKDVRTLPGVQELVDTLESTAVRSATADAEMHAEEARQEFEDLLRQVLEDLDEQEARNEAQGKAQGEAQGVARMLRLAGVTTAEAFEATYGRAPFGSELAALRSLEGVACGVEEK